MSISEKLVEQHIKEYESRLKHLDELFERAKHVSAELDKDKELKAELEQYSKPHAELAAHTDKLKKMPLAHWREDMIQSAGPMGIWDILAQKLEDIIERIEK